MRGTSGDYKKHSGEEFADLWFSETNDVLVHQFISADVYRNHWEFFFFFFFGLDGSGMSHMVELRGPT